MRLLSTSLVIRNSLWLIINAYSTRSMAAARDKASTWLSTTVLVEDILALLGAYSGSVRVRVNNEQINIRGPDR